MAQPPFRVRLRELGHETRSWTSALGETASVYKGAFLTASMNGVPSDIRPCLALAVGSSQNGRVGSTLKDVDTGVKNVSYVNDL